MNTTEIEKLVTTLLRRVLTAIILHPDELVITPATGSTSVSYKLQAHVSDTGKIIGERGMMFNAIRNLVTVLGQRYGVTIHLGRVEEPESGDKDKFTRFKLNDGWTNEFELVDAHLVEELCQHCFKGEIQVHYGEIGRGETQFNLKVARDEPARLCQLMQETLQVIFTAIGKAQGRLIYIVVSPTLEATGPGQQPETSKGRFA